METGDSESRSLTSCCINGLDSQFNEAYVKHELESYREGGLGERAQRLLEFLKGQGLEGRTILEIGAGIGALHLELLKAGAASAMGVDASSFSVKAARDLAAELGQAERVDYRIGDFTALENAVSPADIVLLDRVICCYPDMGALVGASARHARVLCGLAYPRRGWWMRFFLWTGNVWGALMSSPYRAYYHEPKKVAATLAAAGLTEVFRTTAGMWEVAVFKRTSPEKAVSA